MNIVQTEALPKIPIKNIFVGYIDAADEASRSDFLELFYDDDQIFESVLNDVKFIITGRKGTGKSILAYYVKMKSEKIGSHSCEIESLNKFTMHKLKTLGNKKIQDSELNLFWEWVIYYELAKKCIEINSVYSKIPFHPVNKLNKFINSINGEKNSVYRIKKMIKSKTDKNRTSTKLSPELFEAATEFVNLNSIELHYEPSEYYYLLESLKKLAKDALKKSKPIFLLFDDLDEFEGTIEENKNYRELLISLIKTSKDINVNLRSLSLKHKTILLIRSDILRILMHHSTNLNKTIGDCKVSLDWVKKDHVKNHSHPLMKMILNKIKNSTPQYEDVEDKTLYDHLFPKKVNDLHPLEYLLNHSFARPRDIIKFLNIIQENSASEHSFLPPSFNKSLKSYSLWLYDELKNEIKIHNKSTIINQGIELVKSLSKSTFTFQELEEHYQRHEKLHPEINNVHEVLTLLYRFGVVGITWRKPKKNTTTHESNKKIKQYNYQWGYRDDSDLKIDMSKNFLIHDGLKRSFSI